MLHVAGYQVHTGRWRRETIDRPFGHLHVPKSIERILHKPMCDIRWRAPVPQGRPTSRNRQVETWNEGPNMAAPL